MNLVVGNSSEPDPASTVGRDASVDDPEGVLLLRSRDDAEAFGRFYDRTHEMVLRYFLVRTACAATAADLCAETFAGALEGAHRFEPARGTGRAWLSGIARNTLHQYLRREQVSRRARERLGMRLATHSEDELVRVEALVDFRPKIARLRSALRDLPEPTRQAVVLRIVDGLAYEEIARRLGTTVGNARVRVCRGLDRLEELVGDDDG